MELDFVLEEFFVGIAVLTISYGIFFKVTKRIPDKELSEAFSIDFYYSLKFLFWMFKAKFNKFFATWLLKSSPFLELSVFIKTLLFLTWVAELERIKFSIKVYPKIPFSFALSVFKQLILVWLKDSL